jgi:gephyrin
MALSESHVLLAALTKQPTPEIVLLVWDLQYSVLLASHLMVVPSTLFYSKDAGIKLDLVPAASSSQALLVLSPSSSSKTTETTSPRSTVLVVPLAVPATSTIANAMGRANDGLPWLAQSNPAPSTTSPADDEAGHEKLLRAMRTALEQNNEKMANEAFFKWERDEVARLKVADQGKASSSTKVVAVSFFLLHFERYHPSCIGP